ncbi:MAG TPA: ROK family protein [Vicinamibacteria bacterium]|nr:ROK family protein [Vicinamibacteria bacterium]
MRALAVDLGGSHAACAVVADREVVAVESVSLEAAHGLAGALPVVAEALRRAASGAGVPLSSCAGLAFGFCGLVDSTAGRVLSTNGKYEDAPGLDLGAWCRESFGLRLRIENDARLALLGERHAGAARGCDDVVLMTLGTGIGGAAMIGGRLLRGRHFQAGVLGGHLVADFEGRPCTCGGVGCVEAEASTWALPALCRETPGFETSVLARREPLDFESLFAGAEEGDPVAVAVRDRCLRVWSAGAVAMIHAWDPEALVIGGGVMRRAGAVLPALEAHVHRHAWTPWGKVAVRAAMLGDQAALLGAVPLLEGA